MLLLVGSEAAQHRMKGGRIDTDIDFIVTMGDMMDFVEEHGVEASPEHKTKFVGKWCGALVSMEIAPPGSAAEELLDQVTGNPIELMGQKIFLPELDWLYTIKLSHRYVEDPRNFQKTMQDIHDMRSAGAKIADKSWLKFRETEILASPRPKRNRDNRSSLFSDDAGPLPFNRKDLYEIVKIGSKPAHQHLGDSVGVWCAKRQWEGCSDEIKQAAVLEECYVLALERCLISRGSGVSAWGAFGMALEAVCTTATSDHFREYAWENFGTIRPRANLEFYAKFLDARKNGTLVRPKPLAMGPQPTA